MARNTPYTEYPLGVERDEDGNITKLISSRGDYVGARQLEPMTYAAAQALVAAGGVPDYSTVVLTDLGYVLAYTISGKIIYNTAGVKARPADLVPIMIAPTHATTKTTLASGYNSLVAGAEVNFNFGEARFLAVNVDAGPITVPTCIVAASEGTVAPTNIYNLYQDGANNQTVTATANAAGWRQVSWGSPTIAAGAYPAMRYALSDPVQCVATLTRADSRGKNLLLWRAVASSFDYVQLSAGLDQLTYISDYDKYYASYASGSDRSSGGNITGVTVTIDNPYSGNGGPTAWPVLTPLEKVYTIAIFGSSSAENNISHVPGGSKNAWISKLCKSLSLAGIKAEPLNFGKGGTYSASFYPIAAQIIPLLKPSIAFFMCGSSNDMSTTPAYGSNDWVRQVLYDAARFVELCRQNSTIPVLIGPNVTDSFNATQDSVRLSVIAKLKSMSAVVIDTDEVLADASTPRRYLSKYYFDGTHASDEGYTAVSDLAFYKIIGLF